MSKIFTPSVYGETKDNPTPCLFLAKAWMLWRARQTPGWEDSSRSRARLLAEEDSLLRQGLLACSHFDQNAKASNLLRTFMPALSEDVAG